MNRPSYIELPTLDIAASTAFYEAAFGWVLAGYGPAYAATTTGDVDIGLQSDPGERTHAPLPVIQVADLEATLATILAAGGVLVKRIFAFPGGRRFQFTDPAGNELAAMQPDPV